MSATTKVETLQEKGTREFEEAIAGKGPKMPQGSMSKADEEALNEALEESFPASDPSNLSIANRSIGAPKDRESVEPTEKA